MKNLSIKATQDTPKIEFNTQGEFELKGISIPENLTIFYAPLIEWINEYKLTLPKKVNLTFEFEYINTTTTYVILEIIDMLLEFKKIGTEVKIFWKYQEDDEDIFDIGKLLESRCKTQFNFLKIIS
jgi:hypothetical protein